MGALTDVSNWLSEPTRRARARAALQGLTFGFGEELESKLSGVPVEELRKEMREYSLQNPWENLMMEVLGGLPSGGGVSKLMSKIPEGARLIGALRTTPGSIGSVAKEGAVQSALYGAGSAEGDLSDRLKGAVAQGAQGAVVAPAVVAAGKALKNTGSAVRNIVTGGDPEKEAAQAVRRALEADMPSGLTDVIPTSQQQEQMLSRMGVGRSTPMVVDVGGKNVESLLREASGAPGTASTIGADIALQTKGDIRDWLESILRTAVFDPSHPHHKSLKELAKTRSQDVEPLYQQAFQNRSPLLNQDLLNVAEKLKLDPEVFSDALKQAQRSGRTYPTTWVVDADLPGKLTTGKTRSAGAGFTEHEVIDPDLQFWDMVKRAIYGREKSGGTDPVTLGNVRRELMSILDTHPDVDPVYKQARQLFTDESDVIKAMEAGGNWHKLKPDQIEDILNNMRNASQAEREGFLSGVVNNILERSAKSEGTTRGAIKTLTGPEGRAKLEKLVTNPAEFEDMTKSLELISKYANIADIMGRPAGVRLGSDAALQEALQTSGAAAGVLGGSAGMGILNALSRAMKGHTFKTDEEIKNFVMQFLTDNPSYAIPEIEKLTKPGALDLIRKVAEQRTPAAVGVSTGLEEPKWSPENE